MNFDINIILNNKKLHIISNITRFHPFLSNTVFLEYNIFPVVILKDMKEEPLSTWQSYHSLSQRSLQTDMGSCTPGVKTIIELLTY